MAYHTAMRSAWLVIAVGCGSAAAPAAHAPIVNSPPPRPPRPPAAMLDTRPADEVIAIGDDVFVDGSGPILVSRDRGKTFAPWTAGANLCVREFVAARGMIYAVAPICSETDVQTHGDHFFRSTDDGATWTDTGGIDAILRGIDPRDPKVVYADGPCGHDDTCVTVDGGDDWRAIAFPAPAHDTLFVGGDGALYVSATRAGGAELDRSDDRGAHWRAVVKGTAPWLGAVLADGTLLGQSAACGIARSAGGHEFTIAMRAESCEPGMFVGGASGTSACAVLEDDKVVASNDSGATWQPVETPPHKDLRYRCAIVGDRVLVTGGDGLLSAPVPW
jgi:hypothetical protein